MRVNSSTVGDRLPTYSRSGLPVADDEKDEEEDAMAFCMMK